MRTTLTLTDGELRVRHAPLWWPGNRDVQTDQIAQMFCRKVTMNSNVTFTVDAILRDNRRVHVVQGLPKLEQARYIERVFESRLGIENVPVAGEASVQ